MLILKPPVIKNAPRELVEDVLASILQQYVKDLHKEFKTQIEMVRYYWPITTYRRNGTVERGPGSRDIVDLGNFRNSQRHTKLAKFNWVFTWGGAAAPYAPIILHGRDRVANYPARDWIKPAMKELPMDKYFGTRIVQKVNKAMKARV